MKLHLAWPVSVTTAALVLAGCSSSDSGSTDESSASSSAGETSTSAAAAPSPELQKAADDYKGYAVAQGDRAGQGRQGLHRRRAGRKPQGRPGCLRAVAPAVGAHRADRRTGRGHRRQGRLARRRLRERRRSGVHRLAPPRVPAVREEHHRGRRAVRRSARRRHRQPARASCRASRSSRSTWPTAPPSSSKRCPQGKITGEEDRYSKTDLWDFDANVAGFAGRRSTS